MRRFLAGFLLLFTACQSSPDAFKPDAAARELIEKHKGDVPALVQGNTEFALALYQRLAEKDGNVFFSPYSITNALAMTYAGARGNTADEMKATLRFPVDAERLHPAFGNLTLRMQGAKSRPYQLSIANRLWGQRDYGFRPEFLKIGQDFYNAGLGEVDYVGDADGSRKTINAWVEKQTNDKIKDLLKEGQVNSLKRLVLTNAIYFKAKWKDPFDASKTKPDTFHVSAKQTTQTPMMRSLSSVPFTAFDWLSLVELPYEGDELSMVILLPSEVDGLPELEKKLTAENLKTWMNRLDKQKVSLKLPKFKVTAEADLKEMLEQMGMRDAFDERTADFSGMATREKLCISAVVHKAFIEVNEVETTAAAATGGIQRVRSGPQPFHADHPFVFLIRERSSGAILFLGRFVQPAS